jgi:hypothetical protein
MKEPIVLPQNIKPRGVSSADIGLMNRDGKLMVVQPSGEEKPASARKSGTPVYAVTATLTLDYDGFEPTNEDSIEITNGVITETFQFLDTPVLPTDIQVEVSVTDTLANAEAVISAQSALVNAEEATTNLVITAVTPGAAGNNIAVTSTDSTGGANLSDGVDATVAKQNDQLVDADYLYTALADVTVSSVSGWGKSIIDPL